ncbi:MAG: HAD hydrolase family protein [Verrucomicrobia bacterium]|nr:HAD hydrolase family protein [Verrucomicrobiota bacterium]
MPRALSPSLRSRLQRVKLFLCDVDGVLTDESVFMGLETEFKRFNIQDGLGLRLLARCGVKVGWVSNRPSAATTQRAVELKVDFLSQDKGRKVASVEAILKQAGVGWAETLYMGDDIVDLGVLKRAGVAIAPANAIAEAKALAHHVTKSEGGHGAVREAVQLVLAAQGHWKKLVEDYSQ